MLTMRKCLLDPVMTRQCDANRPLQAATETIASYPAEVPTIYADGSVQMLEVTMRFGYGALVRLYGNPENEEMKGPSH
ncbi:colorectal mutant cancer protein [Biomphalaria glabrata]|nr:colorectal mutant cancer protein-like [Biomphalaria glabrata]